MRGRLLRDIDLREWVDIEARAFDRDEAKLQRDQERMEAAAQRRDDEGFGPWFSEDCLSWPSEPWGEDAA